MKTLESKIGLVEEKIMAAARQEATSLLDAAFGCGGSLRGFDVTAFMDCNVVATTNEGALSGSEVTAKMYRALIEQSTRAIAERMVMRIINIQAGQTTSMPHVSVALLDAIIAGKKWAAHDLRNLETMRGVSRLAEMDWSDAMVEQIAEAAAENISDSRY